MGIVLPYRLSPEAAEFCSQFSNNDELAHNLLKNEKFLKQYLYTELLNPPDNRPLLNKIFKLQAQCTDIEKKAIVDRVCRKILNAFPQKIFHQLHILNLKLQDAPNFIPPDFSENIASAEIDLIILSVANDPSIIDVNSLIDRVKNYTKFITINHLTQLLQLSLITKNPNVIDLTDKMINGYLLRIILHNEVLKKGEVWNLFLSPLKFSLNKNKITFNLTIESHFFLYTNTQSVLNEAIKFLSDWSSWYFDLSIIISGPLDYNLHKDVFNKCLSNINSRIGNKVKSIVVSNIDDSFFEEINYLNNLNLLTIKDSGITTMKFLETFPNLNSLLLSKCRKLKNLQIFTAPKLILLSIDECPIDKISLGILPKLEFLSIVKVPFEYLTILSLPKCKTASFVQCNLSEHNSNFLTQLSESLEDLSLAYNNFTSAPQALASMTRLINLNLSSNDLRNIERTFAHTILNSFLPSLLQLSTSSPLNSILALTRLKILKLDWNLITTLPNEIGNLSALETLDISNNNLDEIPASLGNLTNLRQLDLHYNSRLSSLPREIFNLNQLLELNLMNTNIHSLPEEFDHFTSRTLLSSGVQPYPFTLSEKAGKAFNFKVKRDDISQNLTEVLINLSKGLTTEHSRLFVNFEGEPAIDASGPSKDLFSKLFAQIKAKYLVDGLPYREKAPKGKRKAIFHGIGALLAFILRTEGRYPLGNIFSLSLYENLINFPLDLLKSSYKELSFEQLQDMLTIEQRKIYYFEDLQNFCLAEDAYTATKFNESINKLFTYTYYEPTEIQKKYLEGITTESIDGEEYHVIYDEDFLQKLQKNVKTQLLKLCKDVLQPIFEICQGFYSFKPMLEARKELSAEAIYRTIQGTTSRKVILSSLEFIDKFEPHQTTLKNWVQTAPKDKLENFVSFSTGSSALKAGKTIKIYFPENGAGINAHTCYNGIDISQKLDEITLIDLLNTLKPNESYTNA